MLSPLFSQTLFGRPWTAYFPEVLINVLHLLLLCPCKETDVGTGCSPLQWYRCPKLCLTWRSANLGLLAWVSYMASVWVQIWLVSLSLSGPPEPLSLLCGSTASCVCWPQRSDRTGRWAVLNPRQTSLSLYGSRSFITTSGKFFVSSPLPPSHTTATKRKNSGFSMALSFFQEDYVGLEYCIFLSLLSSPLFCPSFSVEEISWCPFQASSREQ